MESSCLQERPLSPTRPSWDEMSSVEEDQKALWFIVQGIQRLMLVQADGDQGLLI